MEEKYSNDEKISENNCVTIRIYFSKIRTPSSTHQSNDSWQKSSFASAFFKSMQDGTANIGHVTISTIKMHASIWPDIENMDSPIKKYEASFNDLSGDELSEDGKCDVLVRLYSLDVVAIETAFKNVQEKNVGYVLLGDSSITSKNGYNCCSLTHRLLKEGGIDDLNPKESSIMKLIQTPNEFAKYITDAKNKELKKHLETKEFARLDNEYYPDAPKSKNCFIL